MNAKLLKAFERSKMSAYELAKLTGFSQSTIGRWIHGESDLSISKIEKIAAALGVKFETKKK